MALLSGSGAAYKSVDRTNFTATAGQTTFTLSQGYSVGDIDVFLNGIKIVEGDDYFATNGTTVILNSAATVGDNVQIVSYNQFTAANTYTKSESDTKYMVSTGQTPMASYLRTPNYGVSSWSDSATASLEASVGAGEQGVGIKAFGRSLVTNGGNLHYITDTRGSGGQHIWYGYNGSSLSTQMKMDNVGRLTVANQPSMHLDGNAATITAVATQTVTQFSPVHTYGGIVWDSGTGRITVPVAGRYIITYGIYHYHAGANRTLLKHNGNTILLVHSNNGVVDDGTRGATTIRNMAAGDYINITFEYAGNYYMGSQHSFCSIHLLG